MKFFVDFLFSKKSYLTNKINRVVNQREYEKKFREINLLRE